ncbi:MAG: ATP phosphoribosyltransferase regulatory subunit [Nitrospiraceae bacterium]
MPSLPRNPASVGPSIALRQERALVPIGMTTILPSTARRVRRLEQALMAELGRWGYEEIILPSFEYLDVLAPGLEQAIIEKCYQFADRTTGRILLLRPDATAQIARTVAMGLTDEKLPLRLAYRTSVFRYEPEHAGRDREIFQIGAELIGIDDVGSDGEIIALMIQCLKRLGLKEFKISVGHVGFFQALLSRSGMSEHARKRAEQAAARKDLPQLDEILMSERVPRHSARTILDAPGLYGREEVLLQGRRLAGRDAALHAALDRLTDVYQSLASAGLQEYLLLDLGEFRGFDYYDGVIFDVFAKEVGCELGGGGRYNHLIGRFGRELPSTGFAFDVERLFRALETLDEEQSLTRADYLISAPTRHTKRLFEIATLVRDAGCRVIQGKLRGRGTDAIRAAVDEGRIQQARAVIVVGAPNTAVDEVVIIDNILNGRISQNGRKPAMRKLPSRKVKIETLIRRFR